MSKLEQNTISLDEVLAMVNALPDAGGGAISPRTGMDGGNHSGGRRNC